MAMKAIRTSKENSILRFKDCGSFTVTIILRWDKSYIVVNRTGDRSKSFLGSAVLGFLDKSQSRCGRVEPLFHPGKKVEQVDRSVIVKVAGVAIGLVAFDIKPVAGEKRQVGQVYKSTAV